MQQLGEDFFACPALTLQENRDRRFRNMLQLPARGSHHGRSSEDHIHRREITKIDKLGGACQGHS